MTFQIRVWPNRSLSAFSALNVPHVRGEYVFKYVVQSGAGDSPHVRGEYSTPGCSKLQSFGSPPRAWGIRRWIDCGTLDNRFTPTCVGNTIFPPSLNLIATVHPHVRGEYVPNSSIQTEDFGSPPRAWGILAFASSLCRSGRFTPTCVGNTLASAPGSRPGRFTPTCVGNTARSSMPLGRLPVHPHVRGEYWCFPFRVSP